MIQRLLALKLLSMQQTPPGNRQVAQVQAPSMALSLPSLLEFSRLLSDEVKVIESRFLQLSA